MSKLGKVLKNSKQIILTKLENTVCGDMERLCSKPILDGYNARLRQLGIEINIYEFYIKKGDGYKLKKNYQQILNKKFKKNQKKSLEKAKEIQQKLIEIDNEIKKEVELLEKDLQKKFRESQRKKQEEQEHADRLMRRLDELNSDDKKETIELSGKVINSKKEVKRIQEKYNTQNTFPSANISTKEIRKISKDINIPYEKIALALGLTGLGGGVLYMNTRKRKNKKRKFGTKSMTLDKDQVKNTIRESLQKNKKVKDYSLKVRRCFGAQHLKIKKYRNFLKYYKGQQIYQEDMEIAIDEYTEKRLKLFNDKYKKMQKLYNNLQYTTSDNRLDIVSITQHPALTEEEKIFIIKKINRTENYNENMFGNFIRIINELYPIPPLFRNLTLEQLRGCQSVHGFFFYIRDQFDRADRDEVLTEIENILERTSGIEIFWNKKRLGEIMNDVYKKDINEYYVQNFLDKEMKKNGLFMDKDGILKMNKNSPIMKKIRKDFRKFLYEQKLNKFNKLGRLQDFSNIDLSGIKLEYGIFSNCNFKGAILKGASLRFCNLEEANLEGANLEGADLRANRLQGANLNKANLQGAILKGSNLNKANLQGADLRGTDLRNCSVIFKIRYFKGAKINKQTSFPNKYIGEAIRSSMDFYDENNNKVSKNESAKHPGPRPKKKRGQTAKDYMEEMKLWNEANAKYLNNPGPRPRGRIIGASRPRGRILGLSDTPIFPWASRSSNNNNQYDTALQPDLPEDWEEHALLTQENPGLGGLFGGRSNNNNQNNSGFGPFGRSTNNNQNNPGFGSYQDSPEASADNPGFGRLTRDDPGDWDESLYQDDLSHVTRHDGNGL